MRGKEETGEQKKKKKNFLFLTSSLAVCRASCVCLASSKTPCKVSKRVDNTSALSSNSTYWRTRLYRACKASAADQKKSGTESANCESCTAERRLSVLLSFFFFFPSFSSPV